ncbi:endonuclease III domain-containing protein [Candidatus Woesearchaeota archaeon]|nr:endonuclease III domain-containing protein [Candidatus Woesearchaeota archaeon]
MNRYIQTYHLLRRRYGKQSWWPTTTDNRPFEVMVGAILTQNTSWRNVEKAIGSLAAQGLIDPQRMASAQKEKLAEAIRPSGYYNQKAERLQLLARHVIQNRGAKAMKKKPLSQLREELLSIKGIGHETADSILLYALNKPAFVIDTYTRRIFTRLGLCRPESGYHELQELITRHLPVSTQLYSEYHALIVQLGKEHCRKKPECKGCPLQTNCQFGKKDLNSQLRPC